VRGINVPLPVARTTFAALARLARLAHQDALAVQLPDAVNTFSRDNPFTSERARRELGWSPTMRPEVGIPEAFAWWKEHRT
jgi:nucleoside-diphosphate-sugar epimerase